MVEHSNEGTERKSIEEVLANYPQLKVESIVTNKYRAIDTESKMDIILRVGCISEGNSNDSLILIPRESRNSDFSTIVFKDNSILLDNIEGEEITDALQLAKGALEIILTWGSTTLIEYNNLENSGVDRLANLGNSDTLDLSTVTCAQSMLNIINRELSYEE